MESIESTEAVERLLNAIEQDRLVILCGAGLSMSPPSQLPSAAAIAKIIKEKCNAIEMEVPDNLDAQAEKFWDDGDLATLFIENLIPIDIFSSKYNGGHEAIADFLLCKAIFTTISTNVDLLIETAGQSLHGQIDGLLDGAEAAQATNDRSPLLKIHGCWHKDRNNTVWTSKQLDVDPVKARIARSKQWLELNLGNKELLIVGFWSDWSYLNSVLDLVLGDVHPASVFIVQPGDTGQLQEKAPGLCQIGEKQNVVFKHVQESGDAFLDALRKSFSRRFFRKVCYSARQSYLDITGNEPEEDWFNLPVELDAKSLYEMRRNIEGRKASQCARCKEPSEEAIMVGLTILQLRAKGANSSGANWELEGQTIRLIKSSQPLHQVKDLFCLETPPLGSADIVICVGAEESSLPANIARSNGGGDVVRGGPAGNWLTREQAGKELGL